MGLKPYFDDGKGHVIFHGDCREILPTLTKADLCLSDVPYGIGYDARGGGGSVNSRSLAKRTIFEMPTIVGDDIAFDPAFLLPCAERIMLWGAHVFYDRIPKGWRFLVWKKRESAPDSEMDFADGEICADSNGGLLRILDHRHNGFMRDLGDIKKPLHPTQKPLGVMTWCLSFCAGVQTCVDPFMGSGTTLRACKDLGVACTGIELEEKYCEIAARRLEQEVFDFETHDVPPRTPTDAIHGADG